jgi:hypothetical protein
MGNEEKGCIECGIPLELLGDALVDTKYGKVCKPCYDSGDTGEPYFAVFGNDKT